jgi:hypothetical protein
MPFTLEGYGDHYVKLVMRQRSGWARTTRVTSLSSRYNTARLKRWGWEKNRMEEQIKGDRNQLGEYLRHGNNCCALSVTSYCLLHHIASFQSLVNVLLFVWTMEFVLMLLLTTCYHMPVIIEF